MLPGPKAGDLCRITSCVHYRIFDPPRSWPDIVAQAARRPPPADTLHRSRHWHETVRGDDRLRPLESFITGSQSQPTTLQNEQRLANDELVFRPIQRQSDPWCASDMVSFCLTSDSRAALCAAKTACPDLADLSDSAAMQILLQLDEDRDGPLKFKIRQGEL